MVEKIEVKSWPGLLGAFIIDVKSLADLEKIAEGLKVPFIVYRGKEYLVFWARHGPAPIYYRFKE